MCEGHGPHAHAGDACEHNTDTQSPTAWINEVIEANDIDPDDNPLPFDCDYCLLSFADTRAFYAHVRAKHPEQSKSKHAAHHCPWCIEAFLSVEARKDHILKEHEDYADFEKNSYRCDQCLHSFSQLASLSDHTATAHDRIKQQKIRPYQCIAEHCFKRFRNRPNFMKHVRTYHKEIASYPCVSCGAFYDTSEEVRAHIAEVHADLYSHLCDKCDRRFPNPYLLQHHLTYVHTAPEDRRKIHRVPCPLMCGKEAAPGTGMLLHLRDHPEAAELEDLWPHQCDICGNRYRTEAGVKIHVKNLHREQHEAKLVHRCPHEGCSSKSATDALLRSHITRAHNPDKQWQCKLCPSLSTDKYTIEQHIRRAHDEVIIRVETTTWRCPSCSAPYDTRELMFDHWTKTHKRGNWVEYPPIHKTVRIVPTEYMLDLLAKDEGEDNSTLPERPVSEPAEQLTVPDQMLQASKLPLSAAMKKDAIAVLHDQEFLATLSSEDQARLRDITGKFV